MAKIDDLVFKYIQTNEKIKKLKKELKVIKEDVAKHMHKVKKNEMVREVNDIIVSCKYLTTKRSAVDYQILAEVVTNPIDYNRIVTKKSIDSLKIQKIKKNKKQKSKTQIKPQTETAKVEIPMGELS